MRTMFSMLAACLLASGVHAQQTNPDNPHDVNSKDRQTANAPADTNAQTQRAESTNPDAVQNRRDASKPQGNVTQRDIDAMEKANPHHPDYKAGEAEHDKLANLTPQKVLHKLHKANLEEIEMGRLAEQNGTGKVKDYARMLQRDHQAADEKVTALAQKKGISLDEARMTTSPEHEKRMQMKQMEKDKLSTMKGADFDKIFADMMVRGHQHVIEMARTFRQDCKDQDVCALIDQLMPKLQQHLQMAEKLRGPTPQGRAP